MSLDNLTFEDLDMDGFDVPRLKSQYDLAQRNLIQLEKWLELVWGEIERRAG